MLIDKLFGPKWKHKNPNIRKQALQELNPTEQDNQLIFAEVAANDDAPSVRKYAISRITGSSELLKLRKTASPADIQEAIDLRLCKLLAGEVSPSSTLENRLAIIRQLNESRINEYCARHAVESQLRAEMLDAIEQASVLADIAANDNDESVRISALNKINSAQLLESIVRNAKRRYKETSLYAQQKLDGVKNAEIRAAEILKNARRIGKELSDMVGLCNHSNEWRKYGNQLTQFYEDWTRCLHELTGLNERIDEATGTMVDNAYAQFSSKLAEIAQQPVWEIAHQPEQPDPLEARVQQLEQLQEYMLTVAEKAIQVNPDDAAAQMLHDEINNANRQWEDINAVFKSPQNISSDLIERQQVAQAQFIKQREYLHALREDITTLQKASLEISEIISAGQSLLAQDIIQSKGMRRFTMQCDALVMPRHYSLPSELKVRFDALCEEVVQKYQQQQHELEKQLDEFTALATQINVALSEGKIKHAANLANRGRKILQLLSDAGKSKLKKNNSLSKFNSAAGKLSELNDWSEWSNRPLKEKLIAKIRQLSEETAANLENPHYDFNEAALVIKDARTEWRALTNVSTALHKDPMWKQFDDACNNAYKPCKQWFEREGQLRKENLQQRDKVCEDLEKYLQVLAQSKSTDVDWKSLEKIIRVAQQEWRELGIVDRSEKTRLNKRFRNVLDALHKINREHKTANKESKELLIKHVIKINEQLAQAKITLDSALGTVKNIQADWKLIGAAADEKMLWGRFRGVCDEVFQRKQQERDAETQQREALEQQRISICESIDALANLEGDEFKHARSEIEQFKTQWQTLPKLHKNHALELRFHKALRHFEQQDRRRHEQQKRATKQLLLQQCLEVLRLESQLDQCLEGEIDLQQLARTKLQVMELGSKSEGKPDEVTKAVNARLQRAIEIVDKLSGENAGEIKRHIEVQATARISEKDFIAMKMEVLAKIDSPPHAQQARMEYQISQLANKMTQGESTDAQEEIGTLLKEWHAVEYIPYKLLRELELRFHKALATIDKDYLIEDWAKHLGVNSVELPTT